MALMIFPTLCIISLGKVLGNRIPRSVTIKCTSKFLYEKIVQICCIVTSQCIRQLGFLSPEQHCLLDFFFFFLIFANLIGAERVRDFNLQISFKIITE